MGVAVHNADGMTMTSNIAHVSFRGGSMFLPVRSSYDRQTLMEHIAERARASAAIQVLLNGQRWIVRHGPTGVCCARCGVAPGPLRCSVANGEMTYCLKCIFGVGGETAVVNDEHQGTQDEAVRPCLPDHKWGLAARLVTSRTRTVAARGAGAGLPTPPLTREYANVGARPSVKIAEHIGEP